MRPDRLRHLGPVCGLAALGLAAAVSHAAPVTVASRDGHYILANGIVTAKVDQHTGDLVSLRYRGLELLGHDSGYPTGHWEQDTAAAARILDRVTIDPRRNGGERAEVSVKGISDGRTLGADAPGGGTCCNIELRYALGRADNGVYIYAIYTHPASYPADQIGESRFCAKLNPEVFDWMTIN
ncbi:MAG: polysaccharide lyase family protein, partial [Opitutaceae bacterium]